MFRGRTLVGVSLTFVIIQSASCIWQPSNLKNEIICDSVDCIRRGKLYKDNMNDRVNPCQDFYTFTCGNWHKNLPGPKYSAEQSVLNNMMSDFTKIIRDTIDLYKGDKDAPVIFKRAMEVYDICLKIPDYPKSDASNITQEIIKVGRLPNTRLWDIHTKYLKLTGESAFFRIRVIGESANGIPVLLIMEPVSAYGSILHDESWKPQEKQTYKNFLFQAIKSLNLPGSDAQINQIIDKVLEFREKFSKVIVENADDDPDTLNPLTPQQLQTWFSENLGGGARTQIPWRDVMGALYHKLPLHQKHNRKLMAMRQTQYFIDLMDLLQNVTSDVLAFHMEIYFIERNLKFNDNMYKLLEGTSVEPHNLLRYIRERFYARWETCIENHNMKVILERMVYAKWFKSQTEGQEMIRQLIRDTKSEIYNLMCKAEWLDLPTLAKTLEKLYDVRPWIGFPPWVTGEDPSKRSVRNLGDILKPNAQLNINENYLYIYAPLLVSPIFNIKLPALYNHAGIGTTIGHELYHIMNACGTYPTIRGIITWWSREVQQKCFKNLVLFVKAYNEVTDREFKNRYNIDIKSNTTRTVQENFPDVMGLEVAYNVYKESVNKDTSICKTLPGFENYSCDQMFYIAYGNTYCSHYSEKAALRKLETSQHSVESVRINGAVAQVESFSRAFNCPVGSPMNPEKKVNLWK